MIDCETQDKCRIEAGPSATTCAYYAPVYDGNGNNINQDMNTTTTELYCSGCDRKFISSSRGGKTEYKLTTHKDTK